MTKRQMPDLSKLLAITATPMPDAAKVAIPATVERRVRATAGETATANLENLNFKVPKSFRKRFRDCAYKADLKHNELLFEALDAWETLHSGKN